MSASLSDQLNLAHAWGEIWHGGGDLRRFSAPSGETMRQTPNVLET